MLNFFVHCSSQVSGLFCQELWTITFVVAICVAIVTLNIWESIQIFGGSCFDLLGDKSLQQSL